MFSKTSEEELVAIHGYDKEGWHTGPMPQIKGLGFRSPVEEWARGIDSVNLGSAGDGLSIRENINGKIVIEGKKYGLGDLQLSGDGNSCTLAELLIPITPFSVATIPMTSAGDLGPISYDIDGDEVEDFKISLIHPMLPRKIEELNALLTDMQSSIATPSRIYYMPFFSAQ
jgi:hypothetical protein